MGLFSRRARRDDADGGDGGDGGDGDGGGDDGSGAAPGRAEFERGREHFERRRWAEAAEEFAAAAERAPASVQTRLLLGASLANAGRSEEALAPLRACLELRTDDNGEVHNALGMALGKLDRHDEAAVHIARAAALGHAQAVGTLRKLSMDYCRECHRPVHRAVPEEADVHVVSPEIGIGCTGCREVFCIHCLRGDAETLFNPSCPRCGGELRPLERDT